MKLISSRWNFILKKLVPVLWVAMMAVLLYWLLTDPSFELDSRIGLVILPFIVVGVYFFYKANWILADRVVDNGDHLLVRRGARELRIPFSEVLNVGYAAGSQAPFRLSLRLRRVGDMGDEVIFIPLQRLRWNVFARNDVVESLIYKVDAARRASA